MSQYTLKELRARKQVNQTTVAEAIGVSLNTYHKWEKDLSKTPISKFAALADYFGVTLDEIKILSST